MIPVRRLVDLEHALLNLAIGLLCTTYARIEGKECGNHQVVAGDGCRDDEYRERCTSNMCMCVFGVMHCSHKGS